MLTLRFFGPLRKLAGKHENEASLQTPSGCTAAQLRTLIADQFKLSAGDRALLDQSVFASNDEVLNEAAVVDHFEQIAVLPPVCGG